MSMRPQLPSTMHVKMSTQFGVDLEMIPIYAGWQPMNDSVLIERLEPMVKVRGGIYLTDDTNSNGPLLRKGRVLACGPGKWVDGTWWKIHEAPLSAMRAQVYPRLLEPWQEWEWLPGHREQMDVRPGMLVMFNARWNDFRHAENRGSGADGSGPLERPLSYKFDEKIHLVQEADIAGILA